MTIRIFAPLIALAFIGCSQPENTETPTETPEIVQVDPLAEAPKEYYAQITYQQGEALVVFKTGPYADRKSCDELLAQNMVDVVGDGGVISNTFCAEE